MISPALFHRRRVFNAGEVDCIRQERRVRGLVALQGVKQERSGKVMNQIQRTVFVPDWIQAEKLISWVVTQPGLVLAGRAENHMFGTYEGHQRLLRARSIVVSRFGTPVVRRSGV